MDNAFKGAVDFLLFSYFGITSEVTPDAIIQAAIDVAYKDATGQGAFHALFGKKDSNTEHNKKRIEDAKKAASEKLKRFMKECVMDTNLEGGWHEVICEDVYKAFSEKDIRLSDEVLNSRGGNAFSYGNVQKWVNMTLKNLYVIDSILRKIDEKHEEDGAWKNFRNHVPQFHIPIDNYILQKAFEDKTKCEDIDLTIEQATKNETYKIQKDGKQYSWSQIPDYGFYLETQEYIKKHASKGACESNLAWENKAWLEIAKARGDAKKEKEEKKKLQQK